MAEFSVQDASLRCDFLTINQVPFPQTYPSISNFLKYDAQLQELVWDIASTSVDNNDTSNEYLILSATKGNDLGSITLNPKTSSNIRGMEDLPAPFFPTNCVKVVSFKSIEFLSP